MTLSQEIKAYALDIGYSRAGITTADRFDDHITAVRSRGKRYDFYIQDPRKFLDGADPKQTMPEAKSIICLAWDYAAHAFPETLTAKIGRIYQSRCYGPAPNRINGARHFLMAQYLEKKGCRVAQGGFIPERRAAARAGVAAFGKNNFAYVKGIGSFVVLSSFVVDRELDYDTPTEVIHCPERCNACLEACPTRAIYAPLKLDPRRCLAFNNWWTQDGRPPDITGDIPLEIRKKMGARVHGCDVCQEVCPRNRARLKADLPPDPFLEYLAGEFTLPRMLRMSDDFYYRIVQPIMYNYIKEKKYFQRNAAIAMGNLKDPTFIPDLAEALHGPEALVRGYAAWALGRISGHKSSQILSNALRTEPDENVQNEIRNALN